jgi:hypothetical protein
VLKTKTVAPIPAPTFEDRFNAASAVATFERNSFRSSADFLDTTADDLDILAQDIQNELDRLVELLTVTIDESDDARRAAKNIRALVDPEPVLF